MPSSSECEALSRHKARRAGGITGIELSAASIIPRTCAVRHCGGARARRSRCEKGIYLSAFATITLRFYSRFQCLQTYSTLTKFDGIQLWTRSKGGIEKVNGTRAQLVKLLDVFEADRTRLEFQVCTLFQRFLYAPIILERDFPNTPLGSLFFRAEFYRFSLLG